METKHAALRARIPRCIVKPAGKTDRPLEYLRKKSFPLSCRTFFPPTLRGQRSGWSFRRQGANGSEIRSARAEIVTICIKIRNQLSRRFRCLGHIAVEHRSAALGIGL
ncbi:hypothetical protein BaRGS_00001409 [Batillaria attramentaria]|uniref:Uncharacterized protein n=1 Tax=Batillaria attramentaria TaxID=370345 RepID=A0ABD0M7T6_9CAEN